MQYEWALARYKSNDATGKKCLELASAGVGYHLINKQRGNTEDLILAFKFPLNKPVPHHLEFASRDQSNKLDEWDKNRNGMPNKEIR